MNNLNTNHLYSAVGRTLFSKIIDVNLDGTFYALLSFNHFKCEYTCALYSGKQNINSYSLHNIIKKNDVVTLECISFDENGILNVKIVG